MFFTGIFLKPQALDNFLRCTEPKENGRKLFLFFVSKEAGLKSFFFGSKGKRSYVGMISHVHGKKNGLKMSKVVMISIFFQRKQPQVSPIFPRAF